MESPTLIVISLQHEGVVVTPGIDLPQPHMSPPSVLLPALTELSTNESAVE